LAQAFEPIRISQAVSRTVAGNSHKAYRKLAAIQQPDYKEPKSITEAIEAFKSSKDDISHGTKRNVSFR
jgi:hypothetical protein